MPQRNSSTGHCWERAFDRLEGKYSPNTLRAYRSDFRIFMAWCQDQGVVALPATALTLCRFIEAASKENVPKTVRRRLTAIQFLHLTMHFSDPTREMEVEIALRRVNRESHHEPRQVQGLTRDYLERFLAIQPDTPIGLRNRTMLSLGYDLLARRSELVALLTEDVEFRSDGTLRVLIRRGKEDPLGWGRIASTSRRSGDLVRAWLKWRGEDITHLFCPIQDDVPVSRALSTTTVQRMIKGAARASGLDVRSAAAFSSHSMRVGAAQDLLKAGHELDAIMRAGGWRSVTKMLRYLEFADHNVWEEAQVMPGVRRSAYGLRRKPYIRRH